MLAALAILAHPPAARAQEDVKLDDLRTPASPVLVLLGIAPSSIERPATPRALAATLLRIKGDSGVLPRNYAIEIAPYWMTSHPGLTFDRYYSRNMWRSLLQTLTLSFATTKLRDPLDTMDIGTAIGFGVRAQAVAGRPPEAMVALRREMTALDRQRNALKHEIRVAAARVAVIDSQLRLMLPAAALETLAIRKDSLRQAVMEDSAALGSLVDSGHAVGRRMTGADDQRVGWIVELAAAVVGDFPGDTADRGRLSRYGIWVTPTYRADSGAVDGLGVFRLLRDNRFGAGRTSFDAGARVVYGSPGAAASAEWLWRWSRAGGTGEPSDWRLAANFEYHATKSIVLTGTVGRDFRTGGLGRRNLVVSLTANFGFGDLPLIRP